MVIVFTNGCFDLLHVGHVRLLRWAREQGDRLIVGLNSDRSVAALKGQGRPVMPVSQRCEILLAVRWVDEVMVFDEPTPRRLISMLQPGVIVKGPDYSTNEVAGFDLVRSWGGRVAVPDWDRPAVSTSAIIEGIRHGRERCCCRAS